MKDDKTLRRIKVGGSSESSEISHRKRYRVKVDGKWYEGFFTRQWFGWQFEGYRDGIQLNLIDEVYEIVAPRKGKTLKPRGRGRRSEVPQEKPTDQGDASNM